MPMMIGLVEPAVAAKSTANVKRPVLAQKVDAGGVFGSLALSTNINLASKHWIGALRKIRRDSKLVANCRVDNRNCKSGGRLLSGVIEKLNGRPVNAKLLDEVNRRINRSIRYTSDRRAFGRNEYWAGPGEVMGARGDCEDYVITKYFVLSELGLSDKNMKVVVVRDLASGFGHAVLAVQMGGRTLILDNQSASVRDHMQVSRYQPLYSINRKNAWLNLAVKRAAKPAVPAIQRPAVTKQAKPLRVASLHSDIVLHLDRRKPRRLIETAVVLARSDVHF